MNKDGEMTMKYLLTFILAGVLLALVMYGVYNKGFGPLIENIEGRANEVLILLNIKDRIEVKCGDAFPESIPGVGKGMFYPCDDSCAFVLDSGDLLGYSNFSISKKGFLAVNNGKEVIVDDYLLPNDLSYERDFYEQSMNFMLGELNPVYSLNDKVALGYFENFIHCDKFCPTFKSYTFRGLDRNNFEVGTLNYDGEIFVVKKIASVVYSGKDINKAVDSFRDIVDRHFWAGDCKVEYSLDGSSKINGLSNLKSLNKELYNDELDSGNKADALKAVFMKWYSDKKSVSNVNVNSLIQDFNGKELVLSSGDRYSVSVDFSNSIFPYLVFDSSLKKYALGYIYKSKSNKWQMTDWIPLGLYEEKNGKWEFVEGNKFYKLESSKYEDIVKINKVYEDFISRRCEKP